MNSILMAWSLGYCSWHGENNVSVCYVSMMASVSPLFHHTAENKQQNLQHRKNQGKEMRPDENKKQLPRDLNDKSHANLACTSPLLFLLFLLSLFAVYFCLFFLLLLLLLVACCLLFVILLYVVC